MVFVFSDTNIKVNKDLHPLSILTLSFENQDSGFFPSGWIDRLAPSCAIRIHSGGGFHCQDKNHLRKNFDHNPKMNPVHLPVRFSLLIPLPA
jgi:hypothetical protein